MSLNSQVWWNTINLLSEWIIEELQRIAPDKFFIVWKQDVKQLDDEESEIKYEINFDHKDWVLACFANQWEQIESLLENRDHTLLSQIEMNLTILDLWKIRKWVNKKLYWKDLEENIEFQLISWWSMNLLTAKSKDKRGNKHLILTTRDWWNVDVAWLTWVAWRCESTDLDKESLKEFVEEWSYLWYLDWKLHIVIPSITKTEEEIKQFIDRFLNNLRKNAVDNAKSTIWFFSEKYKPEDERLEKKFNKNFNTWEWNLEYSNLKEKLEEALKTGRVLFYDIKEDRSKYNSKVKVWEKEFEWYVFDDEDNKTTEFRKVYDIDLSNLTWLDWTTIEEEVNYVWRLTRPSTMYLESENQEPRTVNLNHKNAPSNILNRLVPATKKFVEDVMSSN